MFKSNCKDTPNTTALRTRVNGVAMSFVKKQSIKITCAAKVFFAAGFLFFIASSLLFAVPASPDLFEEEQPDGERITLRMQGDEFYGWTEDSHGYTVIRDTSTREWFYAETGRDGNLQKSRHRVGRGTRPDMFGIPKSLKKRNHEREAEENRRRMQPADDSSGIARNFFAPAAAPLGPSEADPPVTTFKHLVILVEFSDKKFTLDNPKKQFEDFFNQKGYSASSARGSVKDYYEETSHGALSVESIVTNVFTLSKTNAYYTGSRYDEVQEMVRETFTLLNASGFDFTQLTANGNTIPFLTIVHAGAGMEAGGDSLWSHQWQLSGTPFYTHDNRRLNVYNTISELRGNGKSAPYLITTIGVSCHELGHAMLNLPDLYDTKATPTHSGVGAFCLMGTGCWGGIGASGNSPTHMSAWCKKDAGFITPIELASNGDYTINRSATDRNSFYKFKGPSFNEREYFLLENRQGTGFDASLPGTNRGILIWHVDETQSNNNNAARLRVSLEEADGTNSLATGTGRRGTDTAYFRAGNKTEFTDDTSPNSRSYTNQLTNKPITAISASGPTMSFRVGSGGSTLVSGVIDTITPSESRAGTNNVSVVINGAGLLAGSTAKLVRGSNTINANSVMYNSSTSLTAAFDIPGSAAAGYYDLVLSNSGYVSDVTKAGIFLVLSNSMSINTVTPDKVLRGTTVNLAVTGTGFQSGAAMKLDSNSLIVNGTGITLNGTTGITGSFVIPPTTGTSVKFTLTITNPNGDYVKKTEAVAVYGELTITSFTPASAAAGSPVSLTVNGSGFRDDTRIILRNASNESQMITPAATLVSTSRLTGTFTAPSSAGTWKVYVTPYDGGPEYAASSTLSITESSARTIDTITPSESRRGANNVSVTINGMNFLSGSTARLVRGSSTINANSVTFNSSSRLTATFNIPSTAAIGYYDLVLSNSGYASDVTKAGIFFVREDMSISNVTPDIGIRGTTLSLTAAGTDFQSGATIKLVSGSSVINGTVITRSGTTGITAAFALPPSSMASGTKFDLTVTNTNGDSVTKPQAVAIYNALTVTSFTPLTANIGNTVNVTVNGMGFINGYSKIILRNTSNSQTITPSITSVSATQIAGTFTAPASTGTWKVCVAAYNNGPEYSAASNMTIWNVTAHDLAAYEGRTIEFPVISKNGVKNTGKMIISERTFSEDVTIQVQQYSNLAQADSYVRELKHINIGVHIDAHGKKPEREIELRIPYNESDITEVNEDGLVISRYDEEKNAWVPLKSKADKVNKQITVNLDHLSIFAIMGTVNTANAFEDVKYYPNPMRPSKGLNYSRMHFSNMPAGTQIKIYTMLGQTVRELEADASGMAVWDGQNNAGEKAASGMYIVYMEDGDGNKKRIKVAVER